MISWIVSSSVLILAVLALRTVLRGRISLRLQYALWLLVLVRLLVPVNFGASSLSIMNALPQQRQNVGTVSGKQDGGTEAVSPPTAVDWESVAKTVWLTGAAAVGAVFLAANVRLYGKLRRSRRKVEQPLSALPVYESCAVETPCLFGLIHPAVYVTPETLADGEALRYSLAHEQTHCRHGDHLWALLRGRAWPCTGITRWSGGRRSDPAGMRSLPAMKPSFAAWARASVPPTAAPWFA